MIASAFLALDDKWYPALSEGGQIWNLLRLNKRTVFLREGFPLHLEGDFIQQPRKSETDICCLFRRQI